MPDVNAPSWLMPMLADWLPFAARALLALALAELVFRLGRRVLVRATRAAPVAAATAQAIESPARTLLYFLAIALVWQALPSHAQWLAWLERFADRALIVAVTWLVARATHGVARGVLKVNPFESHDTLDTSLSARRIQTQTQVLSRVVQTTVWFVGAALVLMTFPAVRQVGTSLLASAGVLGIVAGFAARPVLGNIIAGLQIGISQPIRLGDVVIIEQEWGVIEEITGTFVVVRIWDERRLVVPLEVWIQKPFQNWTRKSATLLGTVFLWVDYRLPLEPLRAALLQACENSPLWDGRKVQLQVTEAGERAMQLRCLVSAATADDTWDLRCHVREQLIHFLHTEYPDHLPRERAQVTVETPSRGVG